MKSALRRLMDEMANTPPNMLTAEDIRGWVVILGRVIDKMDAAPEIEEIIVAHREEVARERRCCARLTILECIVRDMRKWTTGGHWCGDPNEVAINVSAFADRIEAAIFAERIEAAMRKVGVAEMETSTLPEVVRKVATEMMNTSMQNIYAETICGWATRLADAADVMRNLTTEAKGGEKNG